MTRTNHARTNGQIRRRDEDQIALVTRRADEIANEHEARAVAEMWPSERVEWMGWLNHTRLDSHELDQLAYDLAMNEPKPAERRRKARDVVERLRQESASRKAAPGRLDSRRRARAAYRARERSTTTTTQDQRRPPQSPTGSTRQPTTRTAGRRATCGNGNGGSRTGDEQPDDPDPARATETRGRGASEVSIGGPNRPKWQEEGLPTDGAAYRAFVAAGTAARVGDRFGLSPQAARRAA